MKVTETSFVVWQEFIMLEWKEREHQANDQETLNDHATLMSLWNCGLLKNFMCSGL
jgi:hypothetical protein